MNSWNLPLQEIVLSEGWQPGLNEIVIATYSGGGGAVAWVQPSGAPLCAEKLSLTKTTTQSTAVAAGQTNIPFEIVVANKGAAFPAGAVLNDALPAGLASGAWTCSSSDPLAAPCPAASGVLPISNLTLPALPAGSSLRFNILANAQSAASALPDIENAATLTLPAPFAAADVCLNAHNASACTAAASVTTGAYLEIDKVLTGSGPFAPGDSVTYDITLSNAGFMALTGVTLDDALPTGLSGGAWTCTVPVGSTAACPASASGNMPLAATGINLPVGGSLVYTVTATVGAVTAPSTLSNLLATASPGNGACWNGFAVTPACTASISISLIPLAISAVPALDRLGYALMALAVLALAAGAARRRRAQV
ncbi:MAG: DUF11 domain-containing protein [Burkholderiaceae bacterium]|nr:DUF11 domain-containing protein [Burkholderiaceae bacterium]